MDDNYIIHYIGLIRDHVNRFLTQELKKHELKGISPSHGDILGALCLKDNLRMKELATLINRDKSTITALVNKLIDLGYVEKEADLNDNRINLIRLTEKGQKIRPEIKKISEKLRLKAYKGLSDEEKTILSMLLSKISRNFVS
ncbi:MarR family transcriptional regulator [bacterium]|nr:MarR family transcriptional regulator [bacterium]